MGLGWPSRAILLCMSEGRQLAATVRPALSEDAEGIARTFLESAEYHARVDPEALFCPDT